MSHYFSETEIQRTKPVKYSYIFRDTTYEFITDSGVFSYGKMDKATDMLIRQIPHLEGTLLDMGCGCGCLGIVLAKEYGLTLTQADVNPRALRLTKENAALNNVSSAVTESNAYSKIEGTFDNIVTNPPIHAGKDVVFSFYEGAYRHLNQKGSLYVVIAKKHGASSTIKYIKELFANCEIIHKKGGCYVLHASR